MTDIADNVGLLCVVDALGVTQLHDVVYMICCQSSGRHWLSTISKFNSTSRHRLTDIVVNDFRSPRDIVACERTSRVYVADEGCIWLLSSDGTHTSWLPQSLTDTLMPWTLSVTSTRLLVTSYNTRQLIQFDADGDELRRVQLPDDMVPRHAVQSPTGTSSVTSTYNCTATIHNCIRVT